MYLIIWEGNNRKLHHSGTEDIKEAFSFGKRMGNKVRRVFVLKNSMILFAANNCKEIK